MYVVVVNSGGTGGMLQNCNFSRFHNFYKTVKVQPHFFPLSSFYIFVHVFLFLTFLSFIVFCCDRSTLCVFRATSGVLLF